MEGGHLNLSIGIRTLAFAFENSEANNPFDEDFCDTKRQFSISDPLQFAEDVKHEMSREGEDGSTPLTRFLDLMMDEAVSQGSLGIHDYGDRRMRRWNDSFYNPRTFDWEQRIAAGIGVIALVYFVVYTVWTLCA